MKNILEVSNLSVAYDKEVVHNVSFSLNQGEILGIVGESGSGKSTILNAIMGMTGSSGKIGGTILFHGKDLTAIKKKEIQQILGTEIGIVFQNSEAAFCPIRKIGPQIYDIVREHKRCKKSEVYEEISKLFIQTNLTEPERILDSFPFELSGGMNQRVGICTAMVMHPSLLLLDEPTSALDVTVQKQVVEILKKLNKESGTSMIIVTHNIGVCETMADKVIVMKQGKIVEMGSTEDVIHNPEQEYTKNLMNSRMKLDE